MGRNNIFVIEVKKLHEQHLYFKNEKNIYQLSEYIYKMKYFFEQKKHIKNRI